jgi:hypothetical protein
MGSPIFIVKTNCCLQAALLLSAIHMPSRINPLAFAQDEDFGDAARVCRSLASAF